MMAGGEEEEEEEDSERRKKGNGYWDMLGKRETHLSFYGPNMTDKKSYTYKQTPGQARAEHGLVLTLEHGNLLAVDPKPY